MVAALNKRRRGTKRKGKQDTNDDKERGRTRRVEKGHGRRQGKKEEEKNNEFKFKYNSIV